MLAKTSALAFTHNGVPIQNPWVGIGNTAVSQMAKFLGEFGMTPASRSRFGVSAPSADDDDGFEF